MGKDKKIDEETFERVKVEVTKIVDLNKIDIGDDYSEEKLKWFTLEQLYDLIKYKDLSKETLKLVKKAIKQKKKQK